MARMPLRGCIWTVQCLPEDLLPSCKFTVTEKEKNKFSLILRSRLHKWPMQRNVWQTHTIWPLTRVQLDGPSYIQLRWGNYSRYCRQLSAQLNKKKHVLLIIRNKKIESLLYHTVTVNVLSKGYYNLSLKHNKQEKNIFLMVSKLKWLE